MKDLLKGVKYVMFDFDDTLGIHQDRAGTNFNLFYDTYCDKPFANRLKSDAMQRFLDICSDMELTMGLISVAELPYRAETKIDWVRKTYAVYLRNFCVNCNEQKVQMLQYLKDRYGLYEWEILIVDDKDDVLCECARKGFATASPLQVVQFLEEYQKKD